MSLPVMLFYNILWFAWLSRDIFSWGQVDFITIIVIHGLKAKLN